MAGRDLRAATDSLQAAWVWSGQQKPADKTVTAVADARRLADELLAPEGQDQRQSQGQNAGEAQPAAARTGPNDGGQARGDQSHGGRIPAEASKVVDELTSAIQQKAGQSSQSGESKSGGQDQSGQNQSSGQAQTSGQSGQK
jgi:hypothetical protein